MRSTAAGLVLLACVVQAIWVNDNGDQGEGSLTMRAGRQAEVHELEGIMNSDDREMPQGLMDSANEQAPQPENFASAMKGLMEHKKDGLIETQESVDNGKSNQEYLESRHQSNEALPDYAKHKTLQEIWKKELPCECPFNRWRPVCGVDGNTYPTACFADCIGMPVFVHAHCKYVKRELWARLDAKNRDISTDYFEDCVEGEDDAPDEPRQKCRKRPTPSGPVTQPQPFPESELLVQDRAEFIPTSEELPAPEPRLQVPSPARLAVQRQSMIAAAAAANLPETSEVAEPELKESVQAPTIPVPPPPHAKQTASSHHNSPKAPAAPQPQAQAQAHPTKRGADQKISMLERRLGRKLHVDQPVHQAAPQPAPHPEPEPEPVQTYTPTQDVEPLSEAPSKAADQAESTIEWRTFNGMQVPYDTRDFPNPCPDCPAGYTPACGTDGKTYPSACFAACVDVEIAYMGECPSN